MRNLDSATSAEKNLIRTRLRSDFLVDGDNVELVVLSWLATSFLNARSTSSKTRVRDCLIHHCSDDLSSCQLCWCHLCQLEVHKDELHQVELGDQLDEEDD